MEHDPMLDLVIQATALGIGQHDATAWHLLPQVQRDAGQRAPSASTRDKRIDVAAGLRVDLWARPLEVRLIVGLGFELIGKQSSPLHSLILRVPRRGSPRAIHEMQLIDNRRGGDPLDHGAELQEQIRLLKRLVRRHEDVGAVAARPRQRRQRNPRAANRALVDRVAGVRGEQAVGLGAGDDAQRDAIFRRLPCPIEKLAFRQDRAPCQLREGLDHDQGRVANG